MRGESGAAIARHLEARFGRRLPTLRTIQRLVRELSAADPGDRWRLTPDEPEPALLLGIVAASGAEGWRLPLTVREAAWIRLVHRAAPELGPIATRTVARLYLAAEGREQPTAALDLALAIAPWHGHEERARYEQLVPEPRPSFLLSAALAAR